MLLSTTLSLAAAAAMINIWITVRIGQMRGKAKVLHGDGGHPALARRMRSHANFVENVPLVLILMALVELTGKGGQWLAVTGAVFMLARVAHVLGMDREQVNALRAVGSVVTVLTQLGLAVMAVLIVLGRF